MEMAQVCMWGRAGPWKGLFVYVNWRAGVVWQREGLIWGWQNRFASGGAPDSWKGLLIYIGNGAAGCGHGLDGSAPIDASFFSRVPMGTGWSFCRLRLPGVLIFQDG